jgi:hypothetical protein
MAFARVTERKILDPPKTSLQRSNFPSFTYSDSLVADGLQDRGNGIALAVSYRCRARSVRAGGARRPALAHPRR